MNALVAGAGLSLLALSLFVQGAGLLRERRERREFAAISDGALSLAPTPILTDLAVYPQLVAPAWDRLLVLGAVSCREVHAAISRLGAKRIPEFWWVATDYPPWQEWRMSRDGNRADCLRKEPVRAVGERSVVGKLNYTLYRLEP